MHTFVQSDLCDMYESCARCGLNCTEEEDCSPDSLDNSREYPMNVCISALNWPLQVLYLHVHVHSP